MKKANRSKISWHFSPSIVIIALILSILGLVGFLPITFARREFRHSTSVLYNGFPVQAVGYSRLSQSGNADGKNCGGKFYAGSCYVDYVDRTSVRRNYGKYVWFCTHYEPMLSKTGEPIGYKLLGMTIDLK